MVHHVVIHACSHTGLQDQNLTGTFIGMQAASTEAEEIAHENHLAQGRSMRKTYV